MYKKSLNALFSIIYTSIKKYEETKDGDKHYFVNKGSKEYVELEKKRLENFLFSDYKELKKDKNKKYERALQDRWIQKLNRNATKLKNDVMNKAIRAALGGADVLGFFSRIGIFIQWKIEEEE